MKQTSCSVLFLPGEVPEVLRIVSSIRQKLPEIANGNFNVRQIIETVSEAVELDHSEDQIVKLINADTLQNKDTTIKKLVDDLNASLNSQEIEQLNELLMWTIYAFEYLSVDEMRAALLLRTKRTPLQNLEEKMTQKYCKLLKIERTAAALWR